jgi:hypothetical protein
MKIRPKDSRIVPCGGTDVTQLVVAFRNVANAPKIGAPNNLSQQNNADCS